VVKKRTVVWKDGKATVVITDDPDSEPPSSTSGGGAPPQEITQDEVDKLVSEGLIRPTSSGGFIFDPSVPEEIRQQLRDRDTAISVAISKSETPEEAEALRLFSKGLIRQATPSGGFIFDPSVPIETRQKLTGMAQAEEQQQMQIVQKPLTEKEKTQMRFDKGPSIDLPRQTKILTLLTADKADIPFKISPQETTRRGQTLMYEPLLTDLKTPGRKETTETIAKQTGFNFDFGIKAPSKEIRLSVKPAGAGFKGAVIPDLIGGGLPVTERKLPGLDQTIDFGIKAPSKEIRLSVKPEGAGFKGAVIPDLIGGGLPRTEFKMPDFEAFKPKPKPQRETMLISPGDFTKQLQIGELKKAGLTGIEAKIQLKAEELEEKGKLGTAFPLEPLKAVAFSAAAFPISFAAAAVTRPKETAKGVAFTFLRPDLAIKEIMSGFATRPLATTGELIGMVATGEVIGFAFKSTVGKIKSTKLAKQEIALNIEFGGKALTAEKIGKISELTGQSVKAELRVSDITGFRGEIIRLDRGGFKKTSGRLIFEREITVKPLEFFKTEASFPGQFQIDFFAETRVRTRLSKKPIILVEEGSFRMPARELLSLFEGRGIDVRSPGRAKKIKAVGGELTFEFATLTDPFKKVEPLAAAEVSSTTLFGDISVRRKSRKPPSDQLLKEFKDFESFSMGSSGARRGPDSTPQGGLGGGDLSLQVFNREAVASLTQQATVFAPRQRVKAIFELEYVPKQKVFKAPILEKITLIKESGLKTTPFIPTFRLSELSKTFSEFGKKESIKSDTRIKQKVDTITKLKLDTFLGERLKIGQELKQELKVKTKVKVGQAQAQAQAQAQDITLQQELKIKQDIVPDLKPKPKPKKARFLFDFDLPQQTPPKVRPRPQRIFKQPKAFTASFIAVGEGIRGKTSKLAVTTGLGIRKLKKKKPSKRTRMIF